MILQPFFSVSASTMSVH